MATRALTGEDVELYRRLRLEALETNPEAFAATYAEELEHGDDVWRERVTSFPGGRPGRVFVDEVDGDAIGMAGVRRDGGPGTAVVWGMWVRPRGRRSGAGQRLLDAALDWALADGVETVALWVHRTNGPAQSLYRAAGFEPTDDPPVPPAPVCVDELCMVRRLT